MFKRVLILFCFMFSLAGADEWKAYDNVLYKGTTDKNITVEWGAIDNRKLVMIRYKYNTTNSNAVVYNIYDGNDLKLTKTIDQTVQADADKWLYIGYCSTQNNQIRVVTEGTTDAIKLCKDVCDENPTTLNEGVLSDNVYTWTFAGLSRNIPRVDYEFYLFNIEREFKVCSGRTSKCRITIKLPRTGFYVAHIRSHQSVSEEEIASWSTWTKEALMSILPNRNFRDVNDYVKDHPDISLDNLRNMMIETGGTSEWVNSTMPAFGQVDCRSRAWWIYGHVAAPGQVVVK